MTTEVTLHLPESVIRKIRAYNILVGGNVKNFEGMLIHLIEETVTGQIADAISYEVASPDLVSPKTQRGRASGKLRTMVESTPMFQDDVSGISSGLGDDDTTPEEDVAKEDPYLSESSSEDAGQGLTDEELEADMRVQDPDHEAKADSKTFADSISEESPEGLFADVAGLPRPAVDHRVAKRNSFKKAGGRRAKVRPMMDGENA